MSCAVISAQVGIVLNSIDMMESIRCGRRKQRNPRRKNGKSTVFWLILIVFVVFYIVFGLSLPYMEKIVCLRELIRAFYLQPPDLPVRCNFLLLKLGLVKNGGKSDGRFRKAKLILNVVEI